MRDSAFSVFDRCAIALPFNRVVRLLRRLRITVPLAVLLLSAGKASAICLPYAGWTPRMININLGAIVVPQEAAVGQLLLSRRFIVPVTGASEQIFQCTNSGNNATAAVVDQGQVNFSFDNIYTTNIRGLGMKLYFLNGDTHRFLPFSSLHGPDAKPLIANPSYLGVEVYKTATFVGTGALTAGTYMRYRSNGVSGTPSAITAFMTNGGSAVISPSCAVDGGSRNIVVPIGRVHTTNFKGVGSATGDRRFDIRLNCVSQRNLPHTVHLRFDAAADPSGAPGVLRLSPDSNNARGIGIRLLDGNRTPVPLGQTVLVGPSKDGIYIVPFIAQYYQTQSVLTAGKADGTATFAIEYK